MASRLRGPAPEILIAGSLGDLFHAQGHLRTGHCRGLLPHDVQGRDLRPTQTKAEQPETQLIVVDVQLVQISMPVHRRTIGAAALQGEQGTLCGRDSRRSESLRDFLQAHRSAVLDQRDDHERERVGIRLALHRGQGGTHDPELLMVARCHERPLEIPRSRF